MKLELTETVWLDERGEVTLVELSQCSGLTESELRDLVEFGAIAPLDASAADLNFGTKCIVAARAAYRLRNELELDTHGLAIVLSLIERVQELEAQLQGMHARIPRMLKR